MAKKRKKTRRKKTKTAKSAQTKATSQAQQPAIRPDGAVTTDELTTNAGMESDDPNINALGMATDKGGGDLVDAGRVQRLERVSIGKHTIPPPGKMQAAGLSGLWFRLMRLIDKGGPAGSTALSKALDMWMRYATPEQQGDMADLGGAKVEERYASLPDEVGVLLRELDVDISRTIERYRRRLPCCDIEVLIAETALAVGKPGTLPSAKSKRLKAVVVEYVREMREKGEFPLLIDEVQHENQD